MAGFDVPFTPVRLAQLACALFFAILFLQSGLDKAFDWRGNLSWLTSHFAKSPLSSVVPLMLAALTVLEVSAGLSATVGFVQLLLGRGQTGAYWGMTLSAVSLLALFFGQRIAKDYAGAGGLVPYFLVALAGILLMR